MVSQDHLLGLTGDRALLLLPITADLGHPPASDVSDLLMVVGLYGDDC